MAESSRNKHGRRRSIQAHPSSLTAKLLATGITILALVFGGATLLWEQAVIIGLAGVLIFIAPSRRSSGLRSNLLFVGLVVLAACAFLPASWSISAEWRTLLGSELQANLPGTRTPQPWLTLQACAMFSAGLVWASYVLSFEWNRRDRTLILRTLIVAVGILAAAADLSYLTGWRFPLWLQEENRGWFPNRNQTADVLAVCGILNYAMLIDRISKGRRSGYLWILSLAAITTALVITTSRAGIVLFFLGIVLWHLWPSSSTGTTDRLARFRWTHLWFVHGRESIKWTALGFALIFAMVTVFFLWGGKTAERFKVGAASPQVHSFDYRMEVQADALRFSLDSPVLGVGLGNFNSLFPVFRQSSTGQNQALHPESDWLWAACELGWGAPIIFFGFILWWLSRVLPFRIEMGESIRRAVLAAACIYLLHSFIDVASHRIGSVFVALLVFSMAMRERGTTRALSPPWRSTSLIYRALGLWMVLIAAWWFASIEGANVPSTTATLAGLKKDAADQIFHENVGAIHQYTDAVLAISPLDWQAHFQRGYAELYEPNSLLRAVSDFQLARDLEPHWSKLCIDEGASWLAVGDADRCLNAWEDALRRAGDDAPRLYEWLVPMSRDNPIVRSGLQEFARDRFDWQLLFLKDATSVEMKEFSDKLLTADPDLAKLTSSQRAAFFEVWWARGDQPALAQQLMAHPGWLPDGWRYLAQWDAREKNFEAASATILSYAIPPPLPNLTSSSPPADLERDFYSKPDLPTGVMLFKSEMDRGQTDDALSTIRTMEKMPSAPHYLSFYEGELWAKKAQWELAWDAWTRFYQF